MNNRIPWPVDMTGWEKVGNFGFGWTIWAKGNHRRLVKPTGEIYQEYEAEERIFQLTGKRPPYATGWGGTNLYENARG